MKNKINNNLDSGKTYNMACIFCSIISGSAPGYVISEDEDVLCIMSLEGHPLIITRRHFPNLSSMDSQTAGKLMTLAIKTAEALRLETQCQGINLVLSDGAVAGQDVFHIHMHVKPRWLDDGVSLQWDTSTAAEPKRASLAASLVRRLA